MDTSAQNTSANSMAVWEFDIPKPDLNTEFTITSNDEALKLSCRDGYFVVRPDKNPNVTEPIDLFKVKPMPTPVKTLVEKDKENDQFTVVVVKPAMLMASSTICESIPVPPPQVVITIPHDEEEDPGLIGIEDDDDGKVNKMTMVPDKRGSRQSSRRRTSMIPTKLSGDLSSDALLPWTARRDSHMDPSPPALLPVEEKPDEVMMDDIASEHHDEQVTTTTTTTMDEMEAELDRIVAEPSIPHIQATNTTSVEETHDSSSSYPSVIEQDVPPSCDQLVMSQDTPSFMSHQTVLEPQISASAPQPDVALVDEFASSPDRKHHTSSLPYQSNTATFTLDDNVKKPRALFNRRFSSIGGAKCEEKDVMPVVTDTVVSMAVTNHHLPVLGNVAASRTQRRSSIDYVPTGANTLSGMGGSYQRRTSMGTSSSQVAVAGAASKPVTPPQLVPVLPTTTNKPPPRTSTSPLLHKTSGGHPNPIHVSSSSRIPTTKLDVVPPKPMRSSSPLIQVAAAAAAPIITTTKPHLPPPQLTTIPTGPTRQPQRPPPITTTIPSIHPPSSSTTVDARYLNNGPLPRVMMSNRPVRPPSPTKLSSSMNLGTARGQQPGYMTPTQSSRSKSRQKAPSSPRPSSPAPSLSSRASSPGLTVPVTPHLQTAQRRRMLAMADKKDRDTREAEQVMRDLAMMQRQREEQAEVLKRAREPTQPVMSVPLTEPKPFQLRTDSRATIKAPAMVAPSSQEFKSLASMVKTVLNRDVPLPSTARKQKPMVVAADTAPSSSDMAQQQPFALETDERGERARRELELRLAQELREEESLRQFRARPIPESVKLVPRQHHHHDMEDDAASLTDSIVSGSGFKARPPPRTTYEIGFMPTLAQTPLVKPQRFELKTDDRAVRRAQLEMERKEQDEYRNMVEMEERERMKQQQREELLEYRKSLVHRPLLLPQQQSNNSILNSSMASMDGDFMDPTMALMTPGEGMGYGVVKSTKVRGGSLLGGGAARVSHSDVE